MRFDRPRNMLILRRTQNSVSGTFTATHPSSKIRHLFETKFARKAYFNHHTVCCQSFLHKSQWRGEQRRKLTAKTKAPNEGT